MRYFLGLVFVALSVWPGTGMSPPCRKGMMCEVVPQESGYVVVMFGGQVTGMNMRNDTWFLRSSTGKHKWHWEYATNPKTIGPDARWKASITHVSTGKGLGDTFLFGGSVIISLDGKELFYNDLWKLAKVDDKSSVWELVSSNRKSSSTWPSARRAHTSVAYKDSMIVFGGKDGHGKSLVDCWQYGVNEKKWSRLVDFPGTARKGHTATLFMGVNTKIKSDWGSSWGSQRGKPSMIVFGGRLNSRNYFNDVWALTLKGGEQKWILLDKGGPATEDGVMVRPSKRNHHTAVQNEHIMFVFGGRSSHVSERVHNDLWAFDTMKLKWKLITPAATNSLPGRMEHCAVLMSKSSEILLIGGQDSGGKRRNDVLSYSMENNMWKKELSNKCVESMSDSTLWLSGILLLTGLAFIAYRYQLMRGPQGYNRF